MHREILTSLIGVILESLRHWIHVKVCKYITFSESIEDYFSAQSIKLHIGSLPTSIIYTMTFTMSRK